MHNPVNITQDVSWIGTNDRETDLFEGLWPLPHGVSYNAYIIDDQKVALIETVKKSQIPEYLRKVEQSLKKGQRPDYLIINHMEPDHSGAIVTLCEIFPNLLLVGNRQTAEMLAGFYGLTENVRIVEDGDVLDLGHHKLSFHLTPMVHWPETMMTWDATDQILFSGDAFGGFGALNGGIFDDEINLAGIEDEILRYFSNIVGKFSMMVQKALKKVGHLDIKYIAATHGPVWRSNPEYIIRSYDRWSSHESVKGVVIAYASMYGNTLRMAETVARGVSEGGIREIVMHDVARVPVSYIIRDAWRHQGMILGSCTYENGLFPPMRNLVELLEEKSLKKRHVGIFGSYGWSGGAVKELLQFAEKSAWNFIEPVIEVRCAAGDDQLQRCLELGHNMAASLRD